MKGGTSSESSDNEAEKLLHLPDKLSSTHLRDKNSDQRKLPQPSSHQCTERQSCFAKQQHQFLQQQHQGYQPPQQQERQCHAEISPATSSSTQLTIPLNLPACQNPPTMASSTSPGSLPTTPATATTRYTVEEETTTVKIPMLRPKPGLLRVLHLNGAVGETFTMGEIIRHVKEYITERVLYDEQNPRIVYCGGDLLGEALGVEQFTINEVIMLFRQNCILEPDSCIRIRRHIVTRPITTSHEPAATCDTSVYTTAAQMSRTESTSSTSTPTSTSALPSDEQKLKCSSDVNNQCISTTASSSPHSGTVNFSAAKSSMTVTDSDLERCQGEQVVTSTDSSSDADYQRNSRIKSRRHGADHNSGHRRHRSTSINVSYDEPDGPTGPWACEVMVETDPGETAQPEDDTVVVEYESDTFSVEYDVESGSDVEQEGTNPSDIHEGERTCSESDISSSTSGAAILVVCKESDVEYLADYSDSDNGSDAELSDADKWDCNHCNVKNPPFQRNCGGCWSVRPDWLPSSGKSIESEAKTESQSEVTETTTVSEEASCSQITSQESAILSQISSQGLEEVNKKPYTSDVTGAAKKRKYSSCLSTSDSQEDKIKDCNDKLEDGEEKTELLSDEQKKKTRRKHSVNPFAGKSDPCVVCLSRKKTASIIHGKTGHQVCCYRCAKRLKKQRKSCPICRRPIQKVIRNFHL